MSVMLIGCGQQSKYPSRFEADLACDKAEERAEEEANADGERKEFRCRHDEATRQYLLIPSLTVGEYLKTEVIDRFYY